MVNSTLERELNQYISQTSVVGAIFTNSTMQNSNLFIFYSPT